MRILDLFCGAGGAATGMHQAFPDAEIVGVDLKPQPHYPFTFVLGDALTYPTDGFDLIWASPPCQLFTALKSVFDASRYLDLIDPVREKLLASGAPWIIENVPGCPLRIDALLCGNSFGLRTYRHRIFECAFPVLSPAHTPHRIPTNRRHHRRKAEFARGGFVTVAGNAGRYVSSIAMGIDWMTGRELSQAVPPTYSRYLMQWVPR